MPPILSRLTADRKAPAALLFGAAGSILFLFSLLQVFHLEQGTIEGRGVLVLLVGGLIALAIALLRREGCDFHTLLFLLLPLGLIFLVRMTLMDYTSPDLAETLAPWVENFRDSGGVAAFCQDTRYAVSYLYLLSIIASLPLPELYMVKLLSIFFDILLAWAGMRTVRAFRPQTRLPETAFLLLLFLPTVVVNSTLWGQHSSISAALCLLSLASLFEAHPRRAVAFSALAFSFDLSALFFLPALLLFCIAWQCRYRYLLIFPAACLGIHIPALILGRSIPACLSAYWVQICQAAGNNSHPAPTLNSVLFANHPTAGLILGILFLLAAEAALFLLLLRRRHHLDRTLLLVSVLLLALLPPFLLSGMEVSCFYLAECLAVLLGCIRPTQAYLPAAMQLSSLIAYYAELVGTPLLPSAFGMILILLLIALLVFQLWWCLFYLYEDASPLRQEPSAK